MNRLKMALAKVFFKELIKCQIKNKTFNYLDYHMYLYT